MEKKLTNERAIYTANAFFDDLLIMVDPDHQMPLLRPQVEDYRWEVMNLHGNPSTTLQLSGFVCALVVTGLLSDDQARDLMQRLTMGHESGWL